MLNPPRSASGSGPTTNKTSIQQRRRQKGAGFQRVGRFNLVAVGHVTGSVGLLGANVPKHGQEQTISNDQRGRQEESSSVTAKHKRKEHDPGKVPDPVGLVLPPSVTIPTPAMPAGFLLLAMNSDADRPITK